MIINLLECAAFSSIKKKMIVLVPLISILKEINIIWPKNPTNQLRSSVFFIISIGQVHRKEKISFSQQKSLGTIDTLLSIFFSKKLINFNLNHKNFDEKQIFGIYENFILIFLKIFFYLVDPIKLVNSFFRSSNFLCHY